MTRPDLKVINTQTGEVVEDTRDYQLEELNRKYLGALGTIGKLRKEIAELRVVEPEAQAVQGVLEYWKANCKPNAEITQDGKRWKNVRARLRDKFDDRPPRTPDELKLAVDGALLDPFWNGSHPKSRGKSFVLEAESIFASSERVETLRDIALGFKAKAGVHLKDLLEVTDRLRFVSWKYLLQTCECGHFRVEHAHPDPTIEGRELCFLCPCGDFDVDPFDPRNGLM